jgi:hypothetical protein
MSILDLTMPPSNRANAELHFSLPRYHDIFISHMPFISVGLRSSALSFVEKEVRSRRR